MFSNDFSLIFVVVDSWSVILCFLTFLLCVDLSLFLLVYFSDVFLLLSFLLFHHLSTSIPLSCVYFLHQMSSGPGERAQSVKSLLSVTTWVWSPELTKKPGVDSVHLQPCAGGTGRRTLGTLASQPTESVSLRQTHARQMLLSCRTWDCPLLHTHARAHAGTAGVSILVCILRGWLRPCSPQDSGAICVYSLRLAWWKVLFKQTFPLSQFLLFSELRVYVCMCLLLLYFLMVAKRGERKEQSQVWDGFLSYLFKFVVKRDSVSRPRGCIL